jgi:hypothetical protein
MDLSIIILNYKSKGHVRQCLKSFKLVNPQIDYEIIVVDNDSGDGVIEMVKEQFSDVRTIQSGENLGFAGGNNVGIRQAKGRYIVIMNPDIIVLEESLEAMVKYMDEHQDVGFLAPQLLNPDKTIQHSCYRFPTLGVPIYRRTPLGKTKHGKKVLNQYMMNDWDHLETREVDWCLGACVMVRRSAMEQVGMLDERYFMYFEDADWCRRFWQAGFKVVYYPKARMVHYHIRQSADVPWFMGLFQRISRIHIASAIKYFLKFRGKPNPRKSGKSVNR